jgi:hypothetical protein
VVVIEAHALSRVSAYDWMGSLALLPRSTPLSISNQMDLSIEMNPSWQLAWL